MAEVSALLTNPFTKAQMEAELKGNLELSLRLNIEGQIVRKLIEDAISQGHGVTVNNGEEDAYAGTDVEQALAACFQTDEDYIELDKALEDEGYLSDGWVRLVYGNSGWDVISDYSANEITERAVAGAMELSRSLEGGHVTVSVGEVAGAVFIALATVGIPCLIALGLTRK